MAAPPLHRMSVQRLRGTCANEKLSLSWLLMSPCEAIAIQTAYDSEFTETPRYFMIPHSARSCALDVGRGNWFFRVGAASAGIIDWSGIQGPCFVDTNKQPTPLTQSFIKVSNTQPVKGGLRIHSSTVTDCYAVLEYSRNPKFLASSTKTLYYRDPSRGFFDCLGLEAIYTYSIRIATTETPQETLPVDRVDTLTDWIVLQSKRSLQDSKPHDARDQAERRRGDRILREVNESRKPVHFTSQSDYANYLIAKANNQGKYD